MEASVATVHVLMVEDNPGDVRLVREALSGIGQLLAVHAVSSGEEALTFLRRENDYACAPRPALVLLDLNLPGISGLEVLAKIDVDPDLRAIPVVMLTSSDAESDVRAAYAQRVNCFITKPVDLDGFMRVMERVGMFWLMSAEVPSVHRHELR